MHFYFDRTWTWKGKDAQEVTERFSKWKPVGDVKFLIPPHTVIGARKAFSITEGSSRSISIVFDSSSNSYSRYPVKRA